jgi:hypothetical protein
MVQVIVDDAMSTILEPIKERVEVVDDRGTVLGYFEPATDEEQASYRNAAASSNPDESREKLAADEPSSTPREILDRP